MRKQTLVMLHSFHAATEGHSKIMIRTVDTDVVVLAIANFKNIGCQELWLAFGTGKKFCYIPAHSIAASLGVDICESLPFFHAVTGCDTTSAFHGRGKKAAYDTWMALSSATPAFKFLSDRPSSVDPVHFGNVERFIVLMYSHSFPLHEINGACHFMFGSNRTIKNLPPTQDALLQHVK